MKANLVEETKGVEVPVRGSRKTVRRPIMPPLGLIAGLLLILPAPGPAAQPAVAEPMRSALTQTATVPEAASPKAMLQATLRTQRPVVTRVTTKLDLAAIRPAEFGDWEEPMR
jgi:hypothetical protein